MQTIRDIIAGDPNGISRAGILAWARLHIDPSFDEARLERELAALGDDIVDEGRFVSLRERVKPSTPVGLPLPPGDPPDDPTPGPAAEVRPVGASRPRRTLPASGRLARMAVVIGIAFGLGVAMLSRGPLGGHGTSSTPVIIVGGGARSVAGLVVGDCFRLHADDGSDIARPTRCDEPHDAEVIVVGRYGPGDGSLPFPSEPEFASWAERECTTAFRAYTGAELATQSSLDIGAFVPSASAWDRGDRRMTCFLAALSGSLTTSQRSSAPEGQHRRQTLDR